MGLENQLWYILLGLLPLKSGDYLIDNKKIDISKYNLYLIGYVPQEINLIDDNIEKNGKRSEVNYESIDEIVKILVWLLIKD